MSLRAKLAAGRPPSARPNSPMPVANSGPSAILVRTECDISRYPSRHEASPPDERCHGRHYRPHGCARDFADLVVRIDPEKHYQWWLQGQLRRCPQDRQMTIAPVPTTPTGVGDRSLRLNRVHRACGDEPTSAGVTPFGSACSPRMREPMASTIDAIAVTRSPSRWGRTHNGRPSMTRCGRRSIGSMLLRIW